MKPHRNSDQLPEMKMRIGDRLVHRGLITEMQLSLGLAEQKRTGDPIGKVLQDLGFVAEEDLARLLADDLGVEFVTLADEIIDYRLWASLDPNYMSKNGVIPLREEGGIVTAAMSRPSDVEVLDSLQKALHKPIRVVATTGGDVRSILRLRRGWAAEAPLMADEGNVVRQVDRLLNRAIREGSTDVHLEPDGKLCRVRLRVDGILRAIDSLSVEAGNAVISRVKVLAGLDIAEHRRPQDGRFHYDVNGYQIDLRTSSIPTQHGENVVLRILDRSNGVPRLDRLGLPDTMLRELKRLADRPHGLFFVTGPTGSGKTTTLYSLLCSIDSLSRKICSIEDPIESDLPLVRQSQVDPTAQFGFAEGLRSLLRQDPDVILVGEVRDRETAEIAMRASLTGHFVLATLHTNDAISAPSRLLDMGIPSYLLNSSLCAVLAQRLVRKLCRSCAEEAEPDKTDLAILGANIPDKADIPHKIWHPKGCVECGDTGYKGRVGIYELLIPDDEVRSAILRGCSISEIRDVMEARGFRTMAQDGADRVRRGETSTAEIARVVGSGAE